MADNDTATQPQSGQAHGFMGAGAQGSSRMSEANPTDATADLGDAEVTAVTTLVDEMDEKPSEIDIYEGTVTGMIYVEIESGYRRAEVTSEGLATTVVPEPDLDEEIAPVAHIEPDEGEPVSDALDNVRFAGD